MVAEDEDEALRRYLLNGRKARPRREYRSRGPEPKTFSAVTDPDLLEPYERLFYDEDRTRSKEAVAVCAFYWSETFTYEEAVEWFRLGAGYNDFHICRRLARGGVTPELAARSFRRNGRPTGMTVFAGVVSGAAEVTKVVAWARRVELARKQTG